MKLLKLVPDHTNIHFLKWRVPFYIVSMILIAASWGLVLTKGLNLGVDFIGGQMIRVTFERTAEAPVADLRAGDPAVRQAQRDFDPHEAARRQRRRCRPG